MITPHLISTVTCDSCGKPALVKHSYGTVTAAGAREYLATQGWQSVEIDRCRRDYCPACMAKKAKAVA